jgi:DNA-binding transcriptional LysR family regulator
VLDHEPLLMVASPAHPLAHRPSVSPQDIGQYPFVPGLRSSRCAR